MKKSLLLAPIVTLAMISLTNTAINVKAAKVFKQTATVYQIKKTGKTYKITSQTKKTTDQDINVGKSVVIKGQRYYYSHVFKGYITDKAFALNAKLDSKRAKYDMSSSSTRKKKNTTNNNSNDSSNNSTNNQTESNDTFNADGIKAGLEIVNNFRTSHGLQPLSLDNNLNQLALQRAKDENQYSFTTDWYDGHRTQDGQLFAKVEADKMGIQLGTTFGENTTATGEYAQGQGAYAADVIINQYIAEGPDGGHYQNIALPGYTKVGIGFYNDSNAGTLGFAMEFQ